MYVWVWITVFAAAVYFSHALYVKRPVPSAAFISIINIALWAVAGIGATGIEVMDGTGDTVTYSSEALAAFCMSMAVFGIVVFIIAIFVGYGEDDDGSDEPAMRAVGDIRHHGVND